MSPSGPVSTKANVQDLANSVELSGKRVFVRVSELRMEAMNTCSAQRYSARRIAACAFSLSSVSLTAE